MHFSWIKVHKRNERDLVDQFLPVVGSKIIYVQGNFGLFGIFEFSPAKLARHDKEFP